MRILVVGGAGYIGSHVVREFLDAGHSVVVYDNLSSGKRENLFPEAGFVEGDILDAARLEEACRGGFDALAHLAAAKAAGESMLRPERYSTQNIAGTVNIVNAASGAGIGKIVFSSSAAVYGDPAYLPIDEKHPTDPVNYYGFTKLEIERILGWYDRLKGIRYAALRYFNAAGYDPQGRVRGLETKPANLVPSVMEAAFGLRPLLEIYGDDYPTRDGTCIRDYVHVTDLAKAHLAALDYLGRADRSLAVNLASGRGISVREMFDSARRITGREIPSKVVGRRPGDPAELYASSGLALELLGWKAAYSDVDTIVRTTWEAYLSHAPRA